MPRWSRRYLILDKFMTGKFCHLFLWALFLSTAFFVILWLVIYFCGWMMGGEQFAESWTLGDAFIQLTCPTRHGDGIPAWEWFAIVSVNLFGVFILNGIVLTLLVNWVTNRKRRHEKGEARYDHVLRRPHSVIIGGHKIVASLAKDILEDGNIEYLLIQTQRAANSVRKEIFAEIEDKNLAENVIIYSGDRTSLHELYDLDLGSAKEVYIIGEPEEIDGSGHDSMNVKCWELINDNIHVEKNHAVPCHIMFEHQSAFNVLQFADLDPENKASFRVIPFNLYENWAQQLLVGVGLRNGLTYMPLDGMTPMTYASSERVHLIVAGMSRMGISLAIEAAHIAHYPNFNNPEVGRPRTLITFIDRDAKRKMLAFMNRFRSIFNLARWRYVKPPSDLIPPSVNDDEWRIYDDTTHTGCVSDSPYRWHDPVNDPECASPYFGGFLGENLIDIDFEFIDGEIELPSVQKYISDACADNRVSRDNLKDEKSVASKTTIAICFSSSPQSLSTALGFDASVYANVQQIWIRQEDSGALVRALSRGQTGMDGSEYACLRPFGMLSQSDYYYRNKLLLPQLVAYAYDCVAKGVSVENAFSDDCGRDALMERVEACWTSIGSDGGKNAVAKRWSNIYCANSFETKMRSIGLDSDGVKRLLDDDDLIAKIADVEHNRWVMEQLLLGLKPVDKSHADILPLKDTRIKAILKNSGMHPDIVANSIRSSTRCYDEAIARIMPVALYLSKSNLKE